MNWLAANAVAVGLTLFAAEASAAGWTPPAMNHGPLVLASMETSVDEMPSEMREAYILGIQEELIGHGYNPGPVDGVVGWKTRRAVRQYQTDAGLIVNGVLSKELLDHLKFALPKIYAGQAAAPVAGPTYDLIVSVQSELKQRGYYTGAVDGLIGSKTRAAVRQFQADAGLPVTGAVDPHLLVELREQYPSVRAY